MGLCLLLAPASAGAPADPQSYGEVIPDISVSYRPLHDEFILGEPIVAVDQKRPHLPDYELLRRITQYPLDQFGNQLSQLSRQLDLEAKQALNQYIKAQRKRKEIAAKPE